MQKVAILYDASQAVLSTFELDAVLQQILATARDFFHLQSAAILLVDEQQRLYVRSHFGAERLLALLQLRGRLANELHTTLGVTLTQRHGHEPSRYAVAERADCQRHRC